MTKKKGIVISLTVQECNVFKNLCEEFIGTYKLMISRKRALIINKILDKLRKAFEERKDDKK